MGLYFFDASAVVKYYVLEPGSQWIRGIVDESTEWLKASANVILIADITVVEVAAAFSVLYRVGRLRKDVWKRVHELFMAEARDRFELAGIHAGDYYAAAQLTRAHPLKAYDAVQLAVALRQEQALTRINHSLVFVTGDSTLLRAAQAEGLSVDNPFDHLIS